MPRSCCRCVRAVRPSLLLLLTLLLLPACSGGLNEVKGKVTFKGEAMKGAVVFFHPQGGDGKATPASGVSDENGVFTLSTGSTPGAAPGEYKVTVRWPAEEDPKTKKVSMSAADAPTPPDRLRGRYADPKTTTLKATVNRGSNDIPIPLD